MANTRTYLQSKEEEVVLLRRQIIEIKSEANKMKLDDNQESLQRDQAQQIERLTKELADSKEANKAMILQRKTLLQGKESVQKELDKVLRRSGKEMEDISTKLRDKTLEFDAIKKESD